MNAPAPSTTSSGKALHVSLWIVQVLLAFAFGMAGLNKATQPLESLAPQMPWTTALPGALVRFVGSMEVLGALGLLLPALARVKTFLVPLAGAGLATVMLLAAGFHATRGESGGIAVNAVLGGLAAFVAWGRWKKAPIPSR